jgi:hypothetical protein
VALRHDWSSQPQRVQCRRLKYARHSHIESD